MQRYRPAQFCKFPIVQMRGFNSAPLEEENKSQAESVDDPQPSTEELVLQEIEEGLVKSRRRGKSQKKVKLSGASLKKLKQFQSSTDGALAKRKSSSEEETKKSILNTSTISAEKPKSKAGPGRPKATAQSDQAAAEQDANVPVHNLEDEISYA